MSHSLRNWSFAALSLSFASAALIASACSESSPDPATQNPSLTPGTGEPTPGNPPATNEPGTAVMPGDTMTPPGNAGNPTPPGNEGQMGNIPVEQRPGEMMGTPPGEMMGNDPEPPVTPPTASTANCNPPEGPVPNLTLELVANVTNPLYVTQSPGDDSRLFIVEKSGAVRVVQNGELQQAPFINVSSILTGGGTGGERGLLGMAFHPDYANNGLFYLHFSSSGGQGLPALGDTVLAEFTANAERSAADIATRRVVLTVSQPQGNHNGGQLGFGPDKMLYFGLGDGGGQNDNQNHGPIGNGQNMNALLAKILRIDPLGRTVNDAYGIPAGNFADVMGQQALPEIWAAGLRNPWRFSFDACTGDLYIGDVGQNSVEEINYVQAAADTRLVSAGRNFGWRVMEGLICGPAGDACNAQQPPGAFTQPADTYGRAIGQSVTGGYVYRGTGVPGLRGTYVYADYQSARFFRFRVNNGAIADKVEITDQMRPSGGGNIDNIASFGTDNAGEMYVAAFTPGAVYRVVAAP